MIIQLDPAGAARRAVAADRVVRPATGGIVLDLVGHVVDDQRHGEAIRDLVHGAVGVQSGMGAVQQFVGVRNDGPVVWR